MLNQELLGLIQRAVALHGLGPGAHQIEFDQEAVRCAIPANAARPLNARSAPEPSTRAEGDPPADANPNMIEFTATGTASSTSVDFYGTEMSRACLDDMAAQFTKGVEVFVGHGTGFGGGLEWDSAIGRTTNGAVQDAEVVNPADNSDPGAVCVVDMKFSADEDSSDMVRSAVKTLRKRLNSDLKTGLSIGGWFRQMTYVLDDEGWVSRIIINKVDLDHLATTRRPANPDCLDMSAVRSVLNDAVTRQRDAKKAEADKAATTRTADPPAATPAAPVVPVARSVQVEPAAPVVREIDPKDPKLEDSEYEQPPHEYVTDIKANYPEIWEAGGNIRGNDAYKLWTSYLDGDRSEETLDWVVEREGWAARHFEDFELPGVMAQLKWGAIGSKGWDHQKKVIEDRKAELEAEDDGETEDESRVEASAGPAETAHAEPQPADGDRSADPNQQNPAPEVRAEPEPAQDPQETDMDPKLLQELIDRSIAQAFATRATLPTPSTPAGDLEDAEQRRGRAEPPAPVVTTVQPPAGADIVRAKSVVRTINQHPIHRADSVQKDFVGEVMRSIQFGENEVIQERAVSYREPSGQRHRAIWLGLAHELRNLGANEIASLAERAAPVLGVQLRGERALRKGDVQLDNDRAMVDTEARELFVEAVRAAANDGHPTFREPGTREAATRALTVSAASDKVTTALVSSLLQQLSNIQLGARTQLRRLPGAGTSYVTPKRTVSNTLAEFIADGTAPTEDSGTWDNATWTYKTLATRIKVTRKAVRQGAQWGDIFAAEALYKAEDFNRQEEVAIFQGDSANSLPTANAFNGLLTTVGATSGQTVANTTATAGDVLSTKKLDETIAKVRGREVKSNLRIFASEKGHIYLNTVLQVDQSFTNMTMVQAGFVVETYQGIPIVESSGIPDTLVWNGTDARVTKWTTGATTALVVVNLNHCYLVVLTPHTIESVAVTTAQYAEYEMFCDEVLVIDNTYGAAILGGIKVE